MKKISKVLLVFIAMLMLMTSAIYAKDKELESVAVTDIDEPYANDRTLDTTAEVSSSARYRVTKVAWKINSNVYEVYVTLKPSIGYIFADNVTGTINGKTITSVEKINDEEIIISYAFTTRATDSSVSTRRHRILTYFDAEKGKISPSIVRPLHGSSQILEIIPKEGYEIEDVKVDGESVGAVSSYEFRRIKENHEIRAYFKRVAGASQNDKPILKAIKNAINMIKM